MKTAALVTRWSLKSLGLVILSIALLFSSGGIPSYAQAPNSVHEVTCSDHMTAPWVAFYSDINFGGPEICFEGVGTINLADYGWTKRASSINIAASGFAYDDNRNSFQLYPGQRLGNLSNINGSDWNDRIVGFIVSSGGSSSGGRGVQAPSEFPNVKEYGRCTADQNGVYHCEWCKVGAASCQAIETPAGLVSNRPPVPKVGALAGHLCDVAGSEVPVGKICELAGQFTDYPGGPPLQTLYILPQSEVPFVHLGGTPGQ